MQAKTECRHALFRQINSRRELMHSMQLNSGHSTNNTPRRRVVNTRGIQNISSPKRYYIIQTAVHLMAWIFPQTQPGTQTPLPPLAPSRTSKFTEPELSDTHVFSDCIIYYHLPYSHNMQLYLCWTSCFLALWYCRGVGPCTPILSMFVTV